MKDHESRRGERRPRPSDGEHRGKREDSTGGPAEASLPGRGGGADDPLSDGAVARVRVVADERVADLLTDPATLRHLEPFLGRAVSVGQAAAETGQKPNTVLARVRRLLSAGVLVEAARLPRRGRPIKLYRTAADSFFIPFDVTSAESLEAALAERDAFWERLLRENVVRARSERIGTWGTRIYRDARGRLQIQTALDPDRNYTTLDPDGPAVLSAWRDRIYLDFEDAKSLQREMFALLKKYAQKSGAQRYIVRLGLAPVAD